VGPGAGAGWMGLGGSGPCRLSSLCRLWTVGDGLTSCSAASSAATATPQRFCC